MIDERVLSYPSDIYDRLVDLGLHEHASVVDLACGTGRASFPLISNGFAVTGVDDATTLLARAKADFPTATWRDASPENTGLHSESYDVVVSADALHRFNMQKCVDEAARILRPGGVFAAWWRSQMSEDPLSDECIATAKDCGFEWPSSGLVRGFREFYAAPMLQYQVLRVIPWRTTSRLSEIVADEIARPEIIERCKGGTDLYAKRLKKRLTTRFGEGNPYLGRAYLIYMYSGNRPTA